jgi:hypothetical protein
MIEYVKNLTFENIIGKLILGVVTYQNKAGEVLGYKRFHGRVISANSKKGITIKNEDNETFDLPPDLNYFESAKPGEYRVKDSGKIVVDPDYITMWISTKSDS